MSECFGIMSIPPSASIVSWEHNSQYWLDPDNAMRSINYKMSVRQVAYRTELRRG